MQLSPGALYAVSLTGDKIGSEFGESIVGALAFRYGVDTVALRPDAPNATTATIRAPKAGAAITIGDTVKLPLISPMPGTPEPTATVIGVDVATGALEPATMNASRQAIVWVGAVGLIVLTAYLSSRVRAKGAFA